MVFAAGNGKKAACNNYDTMHMRTCSFVCVAGAHPSKPSPTTAAQRKHHRRLTREDNRYHSGEPHLPPINPHRPLPLEKPQTRSPPQQPSAHHSARMRHVIERRVVAATAVRLLVTSSTRCVSYDDPLAIVSMLQFDVKLRSKCEICVKISSKASFTVSQVSTLLYDLYLRASCSCSVCFFFSRNSN